MRTHPQRIRRVPCHRDRTHNFRMAKAVEGFGLHTVALGVVRAHALSPTDPKSWSGEASYSRLRCKSGRAFNL